MNRRNFSEGNLSKCHQAPLGAGMTGHSGCMGLPFCFPVIVVVATLLDSDKHIFFTLHRLADSHIISGSICPDWSIKTQHFFPLTASGVQ